MEQTLIDIAQKLKDSDKKVQLIYAFNGTGKTRLSREFKKLIETDQITNQKKVFYYNSYTEDLFHWNNKEILLEIDLNFLTDWLFKESGKEADVIQKFQHYTNEKLTPKFNEDFSNVSFSIKDEISEKIKISRGEESNFIWSIFYSLIEYIIDELSSDSERSTDMFNHLEYIFIDDPVSSLDENHLIELAVDLAQQIKNSKSEQLKFIITTHNSLFFNVLFNEFNKKEAYLLTRLDNGNYNLDSQKNDSPFSYHLHLRDEIKKALEENQVRKYHFSFFRNILEKTSTFLGREKWSELLPNTPEEGGTSEAYITRILNFASHSKYASEEIKEVTENDKRVLKFLMRKLDELYNFNKK